MSMFGDEDEDQVYDELQPQAFLRSSGKSRGISVSLYLSIDADDIDTAKKLRDEIRAFVRAYLDRRPY